ncbi:MAG: chorismate-binding protein [Muribaculaceae bacterium]|nr:chorismate-binding protein [Muribaculaceae bacterium]
MGITYKRNRDTTNGPMIFFSIFHDEEFEEEIRSAFINNLSFYAYRHPHDSMMSYGSSEDYIEGIGEAGFVIGWFDETRPFITIPYSRQKMKCIDKDLYNFPSQSTTFEEYSKEVTNIIKAIEKKEVTKVIASRVIVKGINFDIAEKFYELIEKFPDSYVFCFSTPATGCWMGASPELLLKGDSDILSTMALAGTREIGSEEEWDQKNIEEQKIVTDYILNCFRTNGFIPINNPVITKRSGIIEHLCTPITASVKELELDQLESLLRDLSPTPALCGTPKEEAKLIIKTQESFDRGCYGGFCGPFHSTKDFTFNVVIRCASLNEKNCCIYVGGGITDKSTVDKEWLETELKARNISM